MALDVVTVAEGLVSPWSLEFLPDGRMLVTEKPGPMRIVAKDGKLSEPVAGVPMVDARGQGGLLDVELAPDFAQSQMIYWSYAEPREGGMNNTAVARGKLVDGAAPRVDNMQVIYHQVPSMTSNLHYGSRLVWARDGTLLITQGERSIIRGTDAVAADGQRAREDHAHQRGWLDSEGQPVRRQGRRAAGDLVVWPPQRPGRGAAPHDRRVVGRRARHARRR